MLHQQLGRYISEIQGTETVAESEPQFFEYIEKLSSGVLRSSINCVSRNAESPLEIAFFNGLLTMFLCGGRSEIFIVERAPKNMDIREHIDTFRLRHEAAFQSYIFYKNLPEDARPATYLDFVRSWIDDPESDMTEEGAHWLYQTGLLEYDLCLYHSVHVSLQPWFFNFCESKNVRSDALIWVPSDPETRIIVECDGFEHHGRKEAFIEDRKRDRRFSELGFKVLRYSGTEVFNDLGGSVANLVSYICRAAKFGYERAREWKPQFEERSREHITPSKEVIDSWRAIKKDAVEA